MKKRSSILAAVSLLLAVLAAGCPPSPGFTPPPTSTAALSTETRQPLLSDTAPSAATSPAGFDCSGAGEIPPIECEAMVALYASADGDAWQDSAGWLTDNSPCGWLGVTCEGGRVVALDLSENQLVGTIAPELGNLANLEELYLYDNQLTGSIPPELGNLANLRGISLSHNELTGAIPPELGKLTNLLGLHLSYNRLTGRIPPEFANLVHLQELNLGGNRLTGSIPPELCGRVRLGLEGTRIRPCR